MSRVELAPAAVHDADHIAVEILTRLHFLGRDSGRLKLEHRPLSVFTSAICFSLVTGWKWMTSCHSLEKRFSHARCQSASISHQGSPCTGLLCAQCHNLNWSHLASIGNPQLLQVRLRPSEGSATALSTSAYCIAAPARYLRLSRNVTTCPRIAAANRLKFRSSAG